MELVHALSVDYNLVCYFDLDTGKGRALRASGCAHNILESIFSGKLILEDCINQYIMEGVHPEDQEAMRPSGIPPPAPCGRCG